jgi:hypothetical protein
MYSTTLIEGEAFYQSYNLRYVEFPEATYIERRAFYETNIHNPRFPKVTSVDNQAFMGTTYMKTCYLPLCTTFGNDPSYEDVFYGSSNLTLLTVPLSIKTADGGDVEGDVNYVINSFGTQIAYIFPDIDLYNGVMHGEEAYG